MLQSIEPNILFSGMGHLEGPVFVNGSIWCVEMDRGTLVRFDDNGFERIEIGGTPNGMTLGSDGYLYICDNERQAVLRWHPEIRELEAVVASIGGIPCRRANDLAFDATGSLIFTCPQWPDQDTDNGFIGCIREDGTALRLAEGKHFWNGLVFADEGRTLYVADSADGYVWKGKWDAESCKWLEPEQWVFTRHCPDGMAVDQAGNLFVAVYNHACVKVYSPSGEQTGTLKMSAKEATNCAFDPERRRIVATEISRGLLLEYPCEFPGMDLFKGAIEPLEKAMKGMVG